MTGLYLKIEMVLNLVLKVFFIYPFVVFVKRGRLNTLDRRRWELIVRSE